ncbi:MAG: hypothetical protein QG653_78 [Patescibacteria group bacterium]|nr:hypothetical protein [Patescibacteria group bacterium]
MSDSYICPCGKHGYVHASPRGYHFVSKEQGFRFLREREFGDPALFVMIALSSLPEKTLEASPFLALSAKNFNLPSIHQDFHRCKMTVCALMQEPKEAQALSPELREALKKTLELGGDDIPSWP